MRHLRYFVAVAEELSFHRAAHRLHVTQPSLGRQVRHLEAEIGERLFERDRQHVALTDAGRVFLDKARELLAGAEAAIRSAREAGRRTQGSLHIGNIGILSASFFAGQSRGVQKTVSAGGHRDLGTAARRTSGSLAGWNHPGRLPTPDRRCGGRPPFLDASGFHLRGVRRPARRPSARRQEGPVATGAARRMAAQPPTDATGQLRTLAAGVLRAERRVRPAVATAGGRQRECPLWVGRGERGSGHPARADLAKLSALQALGRAPPAFSSGTIPAGGGLEPCQSVPGAEQLPFSAPLPKFTDKDESCLAATTWRANESLGPRLRHQIHTALNSALRV